MEWGWMKMTEPSDFLYKNLLSCISLSAHTSSTCHSGGYLWCSGSIGMQWAIEESFPRDFIMICSHLPWNWKYPLPLSVLQGDVPYGRDDKTEPRGQWCPCDLHVHTLLHLRIQIKFFAEGMLQEVIERTWLPVDTRAERSNLAMVGSSLLPCPWNVPSVCCSHGLERAMYWCGHWTEYVTEPG